MKDKCLDVCHRIKYKKLLRILVLSMLMGSLNVAFPIKGLAASYSATTYTNLQTRLSAAGTADTVILTADINGTTQLDIYGTKTLDLNGRNLTINISTVENCIKIHTGATLIIKDSVPQENKLIAANRNDFWGDSAGINSSEGTLFIESGNIEVKGGSYSAGIGGSFSDGRGGGNITINGGYIEAEGGYNSAGIGGAHQGGGGNITINGGYVNAEGGYDAAGIGGGNGGSGGNITINGGTVSAHGRGGDATGGAGIGGGSGNGGSGGVIIINDGNIIAKGWFGAGIGAGRSGIGGEITINGGTITATGRAGGAGIGGGARSGRCESIDINGGNVFATGSTNSGAGIGGGWGSSGGMITITGGSIIAQGGDYGGAGIGSGSWDSSYAGIFITGGRVTAIKGAENAPFDIGPGSDSNPASKIQITGGSVKASSFPPGFPQNEYGEQLYLFTISSDDGIEENSNIITGSYIAPARHSAADSENYCWLPAGSHNITVKVLGKDFTVSSDNLNALEIKDISTNPDYKVYGFRNTAGVDFCVKRIADGAKTVSSYIAIYDHDEMAGLTSKNVECRKNEPVAFSIIFPAGGATGKIMLWERSNMMSLINRL